MKPVFADTGFFLALINPRDQYHRSAVHWGASLRGPLITTEWVMVEFANGISSSRHRAHFVKILERLRSQSDSVVVQSTPSLFNQGCDIYSARPDKGWSLTDCISFTVMERESLTEALTGDRHYEQAGFRALLTAS